MYRLRNLTLVFVCGGLLFGLGVWIGQSTNPIITHAQSTSSAGDYILFSSPYGEDSWYALKYNRGTGDVWVLDARRGVEDDEWLLRKIPVAP